MKPIPAHMAILVALIMDLPVLSIIVPKFKLIDIVLILFSNGLIPTFEPEGLASLV